MKLFIDTNILLELFENRNDADIVDQIFAVSEQKNWQRFISIGSFYTLTYLIERMLRKQNVHQPELAYQQRQILNEVLNTFTVSIISDEHLRQGVNNTAFVDLEDSYQHQAALHAGCNVLLTINKKDFSLARDIEVLTPREFQLRYL